MANREFKWSRKRGVKEVHYTRCRACDAPLDAEDVPTGFHRECVEEVNRDLDDWVGECRG